MSWAKLLKRVFALDLEHCPNCGGELKIIAAILDAPVIERILTHLGLQARAPPRAAAREQALQAEPGHKQSSGLFVPGEGPGHWPGAPCKGPDRAKLITVQAARRPGADGPAAPATFWDRSKRRDAQSCPADDPMIAVMVALMAAFMMMRQQAYRSASRASSTRQSMRTSIGAATTSLARGGTKQFHQAEPLLPAASVGCLCQTLRRPRWNAISAKLRTSWLRCLVPSKSRTVDSRSAMTSQSWTLSMKRGYSQTPGSAMSRCT